MPMPIAPHRVMTAAEVAEAMGDITPRGVHALERSALAKLRKKAILKQLWRELCLEQRSNNFGTLPRDEQ